jgi:GGDEF domain-containing protein
MWNKSNRVWIFQKNYSCQNSTTYPQLEKDYLVMQNSVNFLQFSPAKTILNLDSYSYSELSRIFDSILSLDTIRIQNHPYFSHGILRRSFDTGLMTNRQLLCTRKKIHTTPGVLVLKRAAILYKVSQFLFDENEMYNGNNVTFFLLDIKNLRSADFPDEIGNNAADFILNRAATRLDSLCKNELQKISGNTVLLGRYGGDEFLVAAYGKHTEEILTKINEKIVQEIGKEFGFYKKNNGEIFYAPVALKNNSCNIISIPETEDNRSLFLFHLKKHIILDTSDIDNIHEAFSLEEIQKNEIDYTNRRQQSIYDGRSHTIREKIEYFYSRKPDLATIIDLARKLDSIEKSIDLYHQVRVVQYIENVIYDRLLNEEVRGFGDIEMELQKKAFQELFAFDMKFVKEFNDHFSIMQGDTVIKQFFDEVSNLFTRMEKMESLYFVRRGGTLLIGLFKGAELSQESRKRLDEFIAKQTIFLKIKQISLPIPIGVAYLTFDQLKKFNSPNEIISFAVTQAIKSWYIKLFVQFSNSATANDDFIDEICKREEVTLQFYVDLKDKESFDLGDLLYIYFLGSRSFHLYEYNTLPFRYLERLRDGTEHILLQKDIPKPAQKWLQKVESVIESQTK